MVLNSKVGPHSKESERERDHTCMHATTRRNTIYFTNTTLPSIIFARCCKYMKEGFGKKRVSEKRMGCVCLLVYLLESERKSKDCCL